MRLLPPRQRREPRRPSSQRRPGAVVHRAKELTFAAGVGFRVALLDAATRRPVLCATLVGVREDGDYDCHIDNADEDEDGREQAVCDLEPATRGATWEAAATFSYSPGAALLLLHEGALVDAVVEYWHGAPDGSRHGVRHPRSEVAPWEVDLNEQNHAVAHCSAESFEAARLAHCEMLRADAERVEHAITGYVHLVTSLPPTRVRRHRLDSEAARAVAADDKSWVALADVGGLVKPLARPTADRERGGIDAQPVLLLGPSRGQSVGVRPARHVARRRPARTRRGRRRAHRVQQLARAAQHELSPRRRPRDGLH